MEDEVVFSLNFNSLNDSLASTSTTAQDLNSNGNLNSASSLSWADDEVENYATKKVQQCLQDLEDYLEDGQLKSLADRSFDLSEAKQWRSLVVQFKLHNLLKASKSSSSSSLERLKTTTPMKRDLEIFGQSTSVHSPTRKFGSTVTGYGQQSLQSPRIRSAHPVKTASQPTRIRSAYPLKSQSALPHSATGVRAGTRSGYANHRTPAARNAEYLKMVEDAARLTIQQPKPASSSPTKTPYSSAFRRNKLPPPALPKFEEIVPTDASCLPPLAETSRIVTAKPRVKTKNPPRVTRKPTSAVQRSAMPPIFKSSGLLQHQPSRLYSFPSPLACRTANQQNLVQVGIVGTSLNLFEPSARPNRPVVAPKLRTNTS